MWTEHTEGWVCRGNTDFILLFILLWLRMIFSQPFFYKKETKANCAISVLFTLLLSHVVMLCFVLNWDTAEIRPSDTSSFWRFALAEDPDVGKGHLTDIPSSPECALILYVKLRWKWEFGLLSSPCCHHDSLLDICLRNWWINELLEDKVSKPIHSFIHSLP